MIKFKSFLAYIMVFTIMILNFLLLDNMMIPLAIGVALLGFSLLIHYYKNSTWVKQILKLF